MFPVTGLLTSPTGPPLIDREDRSSLPTGPLLLVCWVVGDVCRPFGRGVCLSPRPGHDTFRVSKGVFPLKRKMSGPLWVQVRPMKSTWFGAWLAAEQLVWSAMAGAVHGRGMSAAAVVAALKLRCETFENSSQTGFRCAGFSTLMRVSGSGLLPPRAVPGRSHSNFCEDY